MGHSYWIRGSNILWKDYIDIKIRIKLENCVKGKNNKQHQT